MNDILAPTLVVAAPAADADSRAAGPRSGVLEVPACNLAERYRIDGVLAEGGMATVYRAWHCLLDRPVALKMLRPEYSSVAELSQRFLHEARAMARLHSRHAVRVMDFGGTREGSPFMVLELLNGKDLQQLLAREGAQPVERAVEFVRQAAEAVSEAHTTGLVHRDIKPANLFLAQEDQTEIIKVIDFGISKSLCTQREYRTLSKSYLGSPQYMSPEQIRSAASVDERTDIWSLGVVLYELLTGRPPFTAATLPALCASVIADTPTLPEHIPARLNSVVMRCLAKRREDRYSTLTELRDELARCLNHAGCEVTESTAPALPHPEAPCSEPSRQEAQEALPASSSPRGIETLRRPKSTLQGAPPRSGLVRARTRMISLICGGVTALAAAAVLSVDAVSLPRTAAPSLTAPTTEATQAQLAEPANSVHSRPLVEPAAIAAATLEQPADAVERSVRPVLPKVSTLKSSRRSTTKPSQHQRRIDSEFGDAVALDMEARYALTYQPEAGILEAAAPTGAADASPAAAEPLPRSDL